MAAAEYLNREQILERLMIRRARLKFKEFHAEVERLSRMKISRSHLANILKGVRTPNRAVMAYLGGGIDDPEEAKVFWVEDREKVVAKGKAKR